MQPAASTIKRLDVYEVDDLVQKIHDAQSRAAQAAQEAEDDKVVGDAILNVTRARKALQDAEDALATARKPYADRMALAKEDEDLIRSDLLNGWPEGEKTIGYATMATRSKLMLAVEPHEAVLILRTLPDEAFQKVIKRVEVDDKVIAPLLPVFSGLQRAFKTVETHVLTIRQPKEAK